MYVHIKFKKWYQKTMYVFILHKIQLNKVLCNCYILFLFNLHLILYIILLPFENYLLNQKIKLFKEKS